MDLRRGAVQFARFVDYLPERNFLFALPLLGALCAASGSAQSTGDLLTWSDPVRLSFDTLRPVSPQLATSGNEVYVIWFNDATLTGPMPSDGIQFCRSADSGISFSQARRLVSFDSTLGTQGFLAASGTNLYIAHLMPADSAPFYGMGILISSDGGDQWSQSKMILRGALPRFIAAAASGVYLHYYDQLGRRYGLLRSSDYGATWTKAGGFVPELEDIQIQGGNLHGCGVDLSGINAEVGYYESYNQGASWVGPEIVSPEDAVASGEPRLAVNETGTILVAWVDTGYVVFRRSVGIDEEDNIIWSAARLLSKQKGAVLPAIASAGPYVGVVWDNDFSDAQGIRLIASNNGGESFSSVDTPSLSAHAVEPSMGMVDRRIYLTWSDLDVTGMGVYFRSGTVKQDVRPKSFILKQNHPNPFNGVTHIQYDIPIREHVTLALYNLLGQRVATLVDEDQDPLHYDLTVEAAGLPSGIYFYRIITPRETETRKMVVIR